MIYALKTVPENALPGHQVSDICLAVEQALATWGKNGRVVIEANLLRTLLDELVELDEQVEGIEGDSDKELETAEEKAEKYKEALKALVEQTKALKKSASLSAPIDYATVDAALADAEEALEEN